MSKPWPTGEYQEPPDDAITQPQPATTVPAAVMNSTLQTLNLLDQYFRLHASTAARADLRQFAARQGWDPTQGAEVLIESIGLNAYGLTRARDTDTAEP